MDKPAELPAPRFIRRAEAFIRERAASDITAADIAASAGVSLRSLHRGFRSFRDTTPMAALKRARLYAARAALLDGSSSVTEAAAASGLTHLGKFAEDYRRQFGELPSETRRRRR
jgi:AraC-like DNA-binding protein